MNINIQEYSKKAYVAFLDVLGFSELVNKDNYEQLNTFFDLISEAFSIFDREKKELQFLSISDSIIITAGFENDKLEKLLRAIQSLQTYLARKSILVRGAISYGDVCFVQDRNIIVGKGYINAYNLEKEAIYPRVIVDPQIVRESWTDLQSFVKSFNCDPDGQIKQFKLIHNYDNETYRATDDDAIFVNYGYRIIKELIESENRDQDVKDLAEKLKQGLYGTQKNRSKYRWLRNYYCELLNELGNDLDGQRIFCDTTRWYIENL